MLGKSKVRLVELVVVLLGALRLAMSLRTILFGTLVGTGLLLITLATSGPTTLTRSFSWQPDPSTTPGPRTLTVLATDSQGQASQQIMTINVASIQPSPTPPPEPTPTPTTPHTSVNIEGAVGGTATLVEAGATVTLQAPAGFADGNTKIQIAKLASASAFAAAPPPADVRILPERVYDIKVLDNALQNAQLRRPLTLTIKYPDFLKTGAENNLEIYHWSGVGWQVLADCVVTRSSHTIVCPVTSFSPFALFSGQTAIPSPAPGTVIFPAIHGHTLTGPDIKVVHEAKRLDVVVIDGETSSLNKVVTIPAGDYWLEARLKHDRPGPVSVAIDLNGQLLAKIDLAGNDNVYRVERAALLENFSGGTITFRLLNDTDNIHDPATDRNLYIDWWRLVPR